MNFIPRIEYTDAPLTVDFELPPANDPRNQKVVTSQRSSTSTNGTVRTQFNYNEETFSPTFTLVSQTVFDQYETFFKNHGSRGFEFKYFESNDEVDFITVTLNSFDLSPTIIAPTTTVGEFIYEFKMRFRRVI